MDIERPTSKWGGSRAAGRASPARGTPGRRAVQCRDAMRRRRRLPRILLNAATAVSLLLPVAVLVLWVRSTYTSDEIYIYSRRGYGAFSFQHRIYAGVF